jgi:hypothetical protein
MPIWIGARIAHALVATFGLLFNVRVMRALPWSYIRTLPRTSIFTGIATVALGVGLIAVLAVAVLGASTSLPAYVVGMSALMIGIGSSWVRGAIQWHRLRRG